MVTSIAFNGNVYKFKKAAIETLKNLIEQDKSDNKKIGIPYFEKRVIRRKTSDKANFNERTIENLTQYNILILIKKGKIEKYSQYALNPSAAPLIFLLFQEIKELPTLYNSNYFKVASATPEFLSFLETILQLYFQIDNKFFGVAQKLQLELNRIVKTYEWDYLYKKAEKQRKSKKYLKFKNKKGNKSLQVKDAPTRPLLHKDVVFHVFLGFCGFSLNSLFYGGNQYEI